MFARLSIRWFHSNGSYLFAVNKADLAKLRKKTGYTFANCKKALEVNNNNVILAEKWLQEQAQAMGWSKVAKLENRTAAQGLIGISKGENVAVMLEVNCETDFVARNKSFVSLVELVSQTCLSHVKTLETKKPLAKVTMESKDISTLLAADGKSLADHSALAVVNLGEKLVLKRAVGVKTNGKFKILGYTHPASSQENLAMTGKYGVLIAFTAPSDDSQILQTAKELCQHVVGMNPSKIGVIGEDEPCENKDDETVMLHQEFLIDPTFTVSQVISDVGLELIDFIRFECGESQKSLEQNVPIPQSASN